MVAIKWILIPNLVRRVNKKNLSCGTFRVPKNVVIYQVP